MIRFRVIFTALISSLLVASGVCAFPTPARGSDVGSPPIPQNPPTSFDTSNVGVSNGPNGGTVTCLNMDPRNPMILFAGTHSGVYKTVDGGATWTAINNGLENKEVRALTIDPGDSSRLYVSSGGLYVSTNGGACAAQP